MAARLPLEDELGDILEKALRNAGMTAGQLAAATGIDAQRLGDAQDYRYDLTCTELQKIAAALGLNEVGVCAIGENRYPLPKIGPLPFALRTIALPYGIGRVNAYLAGRTADAPVVVVDTGNDPAGLASRWPAGVVPRVVFLTHWDADHSRGLDWLRHAFPAVPVLAPASCTRCPGVKVVGEGEEIDAAGFRLRVFRTPGHAAEHNVCVLTDPEHPAGRPVLFSGDLVFAGSLGGGYHCCRTLLREARRVLEAVPPETIVAPGHGPLTTAGNELRYNPFLL